MKLTLKSIKWLFQKNKKVVKDHKADLMSVEQLDYIQKALDKFWMQTKPFLKRRYSLHDLSNKINVPVHQLSFFFNKSKKMSFSDYVNQCRIQYCLELLQKPEARKTNVNELGSSCGFNNRNTFTVAFKKATGYTPSTFMKKNQ